MSIVGLKLNENSYLKVREKDIGNKSVKSLYSGIIKIVKGSK